MQKIPGALSFYVPTFFFQTFADSDGGCPQKKKQTAVGSPPLTDVPSTRLMEYLADKHEETLATGSRWMVGSHFSPADPNTSSAIGSSNLIQLALKPIDRVGLETG